MITIRSIAELRERLDDDRRVGRTIGFVPTMGWFHEGHLSLMRRARMTCDVTVVSLFVNPIQFNDQKDLAAYPRDEARDSRMAAGEGVDVLFAPSVDEMYPSGFDTAVAVGGITEILEGASRGAAHFRGVTTVVAKLLNAAQPHVAFFGQKDAQQALVIRSMVRDLAFPVRVEVCPTVREADGLAMSSRNVRLDAADRMRALALHGALREAERLIAAGERETQRVVEAGTAFMREANVPPEYFAVVGANDLAPLDRVVGEVLIAVAAPVGPVRLIDNLLVRAP